MAAAAEKYTQPADRQAQTGQADVRGAASAIADYGDVLVSGSIGKPSNLITILSTDAASREITSRLFVGLLKFDKNLNIVPWAADSYKVFDDGLRIRFKLRRGIMWSDGNELDLDDVEFTYRLTIDPNTPTAYSGDFRQIKEFRRLDDRTFEVIYDKPFPRALMSWMTDILPRRALQGEDLRATAQLRNPVTSGPFRLKSWESDARLSLRANMSYFEGRPNLDGVVYRVIRDSSTMFLELQAGKLDTMELSKQQYVFQSQKAEFAARFNVYRYLAFAYTFMGYNLKSPLFSDVRVRRAFAHAINKRDIVNGALFEQGVPSFGPYRPGSWAYNDNITDYSYDKSRAEALLAEAGWSRGEDGWQTRNGQRFSFTLLVNQGNAERIKAAVLIQRQLGEIGVQVKIRAVEWSAFINEFVNKGHFDALILGWTITVEPDLFDVWHSSRAFAGGLNFIGYKNAEVDKLLEEARSTFNQAFRKKCYDRVQEILHEEQPYCFLYVPYSLTAVSRRIHGIEEAPAGIGHNFDRWWVPESRQVYHNFLQP